MKDWWQNLALREKQMLAAGTIVVLLFLCYAIIWSPFVNKITSMRKQIQHNQELLNWMQDADKRMTNLVKSSKNHSTQLTGSLLSTMQGAINKSIFAQHVTQLRQADNDSVQLDLQKVDFDQLIILLTKLSNQYGLIITQMTATPTGAPGEVMASIVVK
jgi:general secretion pathway protein M